MTDLRVLDAWIQPRHLDPETLVSYRDQFTAHPARLIVIKNFLVDRVAERLTRFLSSEAEFQTEYGCYSKEGAVTEDEWRAGSESDRFFRFQKLVATPAKFQMSPNALTYLQFRKAFQRTEMKEWFETISGLPLGWSDDFGAHSMIQGDFLRPHSDDNRDRQLALVLYLSQGWCPDYGGLLRVAHPDGRFTDVEPTYNSLIAFDVLASPSHLVTPIAARAGAYQRLTIGGWYHRVSGSHT